MNMDTILFYIFFMGLGLAISIFYTDYLKRSIFDRMNIPKRFKNMGIVILMFFGWFDIIINVFSPIITFLNGYSDILASAFTIGVFITILEFTRYIKSFEEVGIV